MDYWAKAPVPRDQMVLFATTLDSRIPQDHEVRLLHEILAGLDWSPWEAHYHGRLGQPPIHPRTLAALWLYGLRHGVRSSRKLEYVAGHNVDFMWLAEGHCPDHTTLATFRTKFATELQTLFRSVARIAMQAGFLRLIDVGFDGTRGKANCNRYETWTAEKVESKLAALSAEFQKALEESRGSDQMDNLQQAEPAGSLPPHLADMQARREILGEILQRLKVADAARKREGGDLAKTPAQVPKTDPDARVMPNKEGGYAVNYNPVVAAEGHGGYLVDANVLTTVNEHDELVPSIDRIVATFGEKPVRVLADGAFATGPNIVAFEDREMEFFSPLPIVDQAGNPAIRPDPAQPVAESEWLKLPINPQSKCLDKSCFIYDAQGDIYRCPMGRELPFDEVKRDVRHGKKVEFHVYRSTSCSDCPLAGKCISNRNTAGTRTVNRDAYTDDRERHAAKMKTEEARAKYNRRMHIAETPFAFIKQLLGLRQFLLRGLEKVKTEWLWACTVVNISKLMRDLKRVRAQCAAAMAETAGS